MSVKYGRFIVFEWDDDFNAPPFECSIGDFDCRNAAIDLYLRTIKMNTTNFVGVFDCEERSFICTRKPDNSEED